MLAPLGAYSSGYHGFGPFHPHVVDRSSGHEWGHEPVLNAECVLRFFQPAKDSEDLERLPQGRSGDELRVGAGYLVGHTRRKKSGR